MLDYNVLNSKSDIKLPKESEYIKDLLSSNINLPENLLEIKDDLKVYLVEKEYIARPDLISLAFYGTDQYADVLCKVNGISNPFELNEGELIFIPAFGYVQRAFNRSEPNDVIENDDYLGKTKINQKFKDERHSANEQTYGDRNYVIDFNRGLIFY